MSFFVSFSRQEVREIGRNFPGEFFGMRNTREWCQEEENAPSSNRPLKMSRRIGKYRSGSIEIIL